MTYWMLDILITHRRMRGLTESQLKELIEKADDVESLRVIKEYLEQNDFRYPQIELKAPAMVERCIERAKAILWQQQEDEVRQLFMDALGDPFRPLL